MIDMPVQRRPKLLFWAAIVTPLNIIAAAALSLANFNDSHLMFLAAISTFAAYKEEPQLFVKRRNLAFHWVGSLIVLALVAELTRMIQNYFTGG